MARLCDCDAVGPDGTDSETLSYQADQALEDWSRA